MPRTTRAKRLEKCEGCRREYSPWMKNSNLCKFCSSKRLRNVAQGIVDAENTKDDYKLKDCWKDMKNMIDDNAIRKKNALNAKSEIEKKK